MVTKIGKYIFGMIAILLATGCAKPNFEWVKINPEKIQLAKSSTPYSDQVRRVNVVWQLKSKDTVFNYPESNGFFVAEERGFDVAAKQQLLEKNIRKTQRSVGRFKANTLKPFVKAAKKQAMMTANHAKKVASSVSDAEKLNSALKIPLNSKALKAGKSVASFGPSASEIREMAFNDIKKKNPELEQKSEEKQQRGKNLMWAGLILVVLGGIMGFVFGRSAFLISVAGLVFAAIGYFFRI